MTHLRECLANDYGETYDCICDRLRKCELRVRTEPYDVAYLAGLDAAREAVVRLKKHVEFPGQPVNYIHPDYFIDAIDALREVSE